MNQLEYYIVWIDSHISETKAYHHHKETTAWVATAFYWTSIVVLSSQIPKNIGVIARLTIFGLMIIATGAVGAFVFIQLSLRKKSAEEIQSLMILKRDLLNMTDADDISQEIARFRQITRLEIQPPYPVAFTVASCFIFLTGFIIAAIFILAPIISNILIELIHT